MFTKLSDYLLKQPRLTRTTETFLVANAEWQHSITKLRSVEPETEVRNYRTVNVETEVTAETDERFNRLKRNIKSLNSSGYLTPN